MEIAEYRKLVNLTWNIFSTYIEAPLTDDLEEEFTARMLDETRQFDGTEAERIKRDLVDSFIAEYVRIRSVKDGKNKSGDVPEA